MPKHVAVVREPFDVTLSVDACVNLDSKAKTVNKMSTNAWIQMYVVMSIKSVQTPLGHTNVHVGQTIQWTTTAYVKVKHPVCPQLLLYVGLINMLKHGNYITSKRSHFAWTSSLAVLVYMYNYFVVDINECTSTELNTCEHDCVNSEGGFSCRCRTGYVSLNATHCQGRLSKYRIRTVQ